jgi:pentose-5-phosphate-3-epimerase
MSKIGSICDIGVPGLITTPAFLSFAEHGADMISIHVESTPHIHRAIQMIKHLDKKAGVECCAFSYGI